METITLPYWIFIVLLVFAAVMVLDRILLPGMRWYLKRRVNRVIEEINTRLDMGNCPFCKQRVDIKEIKTEERGNGFIEKEKMYMCPHCESILGFAMKMR